MTMAQDEAALAIHHCALDVANFYELKRKLGRDPTFEEFACYGHIDPEHSTELRLMMWDTFQLFILPEFARLIQRYSEELTVEKLYESLLQTAEVYARNIQASDPAACSPDQIVQMVMKEHNVANFMVHLNGPWVHRFYCDIRHFIQELFVDELKKDH